MKHIICCMFLASKSNVKLQVEVDGKNLNQCNQVYSQINIQLSQKQLCAGGEILKDSCNVSFEIVRFCTNRC